MFKKTLLEESPTTQFWPILNANALDMAKSNLILTISIFCFVLSTPCSLRPEIQIRALLSSETGNKAGWSVFQFLVTPGKNFTILRLYIKPSKTGEVPLCRVYYNVENTFKNCSHSKTAGITWIFKKLEKCNVLSSPCTIIISLLHLKCKS